MRRAFAGLTIAAGLGAVLGAGGLGLTTAWAQDAAKSAAAGLPPLTREDGAPPPTVELKDLSLHSGGAQLRASGRPHLLGATSGSAPSAAMAGDAGLAASGRTLEDKARRQ
jgi:hypothetical protein